MITSYQPSEYWIKYAKIKGKEVNAFIDTPPIYSGLMFNVYPRKGHGLLVKDNKDNQSILINNLEDAEMLLVNLEIYVNKLKREREEDLRCQLEIEKD